MPSTVRLKVLCVDDDDDACEMLSELLNAFDIDATCAPSAAAAWPLIKAGHFDIFVLDAWLPGFDGFQFCRQLREFDATTPILFYSGAAYEADSQRGIAAGASAYVVKPDVETLIHTLTSLAAKPEVRRLARQWIDNDSAPAQVALLG